MAGGDSRKSPSSCETSDSWSQAGPLQMMARAGRFSVNSCAGRWFARSLGPQPLEVVDGDVRPSG